MVNERKSPRRAAAVSQVHCEFGIGESLFPAIVLNESKEGFGVLVAGLQSVAANKTARLHNNRGWFDCRVAYAMKITSLNVAACLIPRHEEMPENIDEDGSDATQISAADIERFMAKYSGPWLRLGVRTVRQTLKPAV